MQFNILIPPKPQSRPRFTSKGGGRAYEKKDMANWKRELKRQILKNDPQLLSDCPVYVYVTNFIYPPKYILNSKKNKEQLENETMYCFKKPDLDNYFKAVTDSVNSVLYKDDGQIAEMGSKKVYSLNPRIEIIIERLDV